MINENILPKKDNKMNTYFCILYFFIDRIENKITLLFLSTLVFPKTIVSVVFCICSNITKIFFIFGGILTCFIIFFTQY